MRASREAVMAEEFSTSADEIMRRQSLADEVRRMADLERDFPAGEFSDVDSIIAKINVAGAYLLTEEVVALRRALAAVAAVVGFVMSRDERQYPCMRELSRGIESYPEIVAAIDRLVDRFGKIRDNASPELQDIRRIIREREGQVSKRLQQILTSAKSAGIVDADAVVSIRDGRAVIPVAASNKRKLQGFIHDETSGSGLLPRARDCRPAGIWR